MMRKKREYEVRQAKPEAKFNSELVSKFVCQIMKDGKKNTALKVVYLFLNKVIFFHSKIENKELNYIDNTNGNKIIINSEKELNSKLILQNEEGIINPEIYLNDMFSKLFLTHALRSIKIGGTTYRIPYVIIQRVKLFKAMKLLRDICRTYSKKNGVKFDNALFNEYQNIYNNTGECLKYINGMNKTIQSNLAYANMFRKKRNKRT